MHFNCLFYIFFNTFFSSFITISQNSITYNLIRYGSNECIILFVDNTEYMHMKKHSQRSRNLSSKYTMSICEYLEIIRQTPCVSCLYDPAFLLRNNYPIKHETYGQNINAYARKIYLKDIFFGNMHLYSDHRLRVFRIIVS